MTERPSGLEVKACSVARLNRNLLGCGNDLARAKETAEIVANSLSLEITYLPQFREFNNGLF